MNSMTQGRPLPPDPPVHTAPAAGQPVPAGVQTWADAAIVSRYLGTSALAAVGASSSVQFLVIGFCTGICCGFGVPIAQTFGAEDLRTMRRLIFHAMALTLGFAVVLTTACAVLCPQILHMLSTSEAIFDGAYAYLLIIFLGIPFTLLYNLLSAILRAVGDSRTPFLFLALSAFLNIVLDLLAVIVFDMGVAGAALATIASQAVSGILCWRYIARHVPVLWLSRENMKFDGADGAADAENGRADGGCSRPSPPSAAWSCSRRTTIWAASTPPASPPACASSSWRCARSTRWQRRSRRSAGRTSGARKPGPYSVWASALGVLVGVIYGLLAGMLLIFGGRPLSMIFISGDAADAPVLDAATQYLRAMGFFYWVLGILNVTRMATQGLGYAGLAIFSGAVGDDRARRRQPDLRAGVRLCRHFALPTSPRGFPPPCTSRRCAHGASAASRAKSNGRTPRRCPNSPERRRRKHAPSLCII